ncbi:hypothetical protein ZTR_04915 [Talaromyces verruculosus]|nr:hypothetical protein ZTR_04915 [Talaromyces verruculosus]
MMNKGTGRTPKVPSERFNIDGHFHPNNERPGSFNVLGGYFLKGDFQDFDPSMFGISPIEAMWMEPQQRKLLVVVYEAFESAGVSLEAISGSTTAIFAGSFTSDYQQMSFKEPDFCHSYAATGVDPVLWSTPLALRPFMPCTMLATLSVMESVPGAIVGCVSLIITVDQHMNTAKLGVLSPTSTCRTVDESADGYGRADGVGAVYLKRLSDAVLDGDPIRGVLRTSAVNSNGKAPAVGISHPNLLCQKDVIQHAYRRGGDLDPRLTGYFEIHSTGTPIGDPLEVNAVALAMNDKRTDADQRLLIGAVKTNIGHSGAASGLCAAIKACLTVENGIIPPTRRLVKPNPKINWKDWKVQVVTEPRPFPAHLPVKRVSVNSFGCGEDPEGSPLTAGGILTGKNPEYAMTNGLARSVTPGQASLALITLDFDLESTSVSQLASIVAKTAARQSKKNDIHETEAPLFLTPFTEGQYLVAAAQHGEITWTADKREHDLLNAGEVEVKLSYGGLNKEDTVAINGNDYTTTFSDEISGTIPKVGSGVTDLKVGDVVVGFAFDKFATFQRTSADLVQKVEKDEDVTKLASVPWSFAQAIYGLDTLPVLSLALSAKPFIVAYSEADASTFVSKFGIAREQVVISTISSLARDYKALTNGRGFNAILSGGYTDPALARESWCYTAPLGRFVDFGRKNVLKRALLDTIPLHRSASFLSYDILDLYAHKPQSLAYLLKSAVTLFRKDPSVLVEDAEVYNIADLESAVSSFSDSLISSKKLIAYTPTGRWTSCFLDSMARYRVNHGKKACSIVLPMVLGVGYVAEHPEREPRRPRRCQLGPRQAPEVHQQRRHTDGFWLEDTRFKTLLESMKSADAAGSPEASRTILTTIRTAASAAEAVQITSEYFTQKLSHLLVLDLDIFEPHTKAIADYGLDSMIGAELRNWIFKELGLDISFQRLLGPELTIWKFAIEVCANQGQVLEESA